MRVEIGLDPLQDLFVGEAFALEPIADFVLEQPGRLDVFDLGFRLGHTSLMRGLRFEVFSHARCLPTDSDAEARRVSLRYRGCMPDDPAELLTEHKDRERAESFGTEAERYERARPSYPSALVDDLMSDQPRAVLDVGCGTGKAGRLFVERGCVVTGVEPDPRMADIARTFGIDVDVTTFEDWDDGGRQFDLVTAAQAWHWVDPTIGPAKARRVLRGEGRLAIFANHGRHDPEMQRALDAIYARHTDWDSLAIARGRDDTRRGFIASITASEGFDKPQFRTYEWDQEYTTEQWIDTLRTHSNHIALAPEVLDALLTEVAHAIEDRGGVLHSHVVTELITARAS